jgi:glycyl-tRNA synthetase beta subunit
LELALSKNDYVNYLKNLNTLSSSIKIFFDNVMINVEDEDTKINRLSLLVLINNHYTNFANIAILSH